MVMAPGQTSDQALEAAFADLQDAINSPEMADEAYWDESPTEAPRVAMAPPGLPGAPLSPYVQIESLARLAMVTRRHASFEALRKSLPAGEEIHQNAGGQWVRTVSRYVKGASRIVNGVLQHKIEYYDRYVALSLEQAQKHSRPEAELDFWNGFTWMRRGVKPEKDFATMLNNQATGATDTEWVDAGDAEQAVAQAITSRHLASLPPIPVTLTADAAEAVPAASPAARRGPGRPRKVEE